MAELDASSPWSWLAFAAVVLGLPVFLGLVVPRLPWTRPLFQGDRRPWFLYVGTFVAVLWIVAAVVVLALARTGAGLSTLGVVPPRTTTSILLVAVTAVFLFYILRRRWSDETRAAVGADVLAPYSRAERLFMLLVLGPSAALCEEAVYRGFVLSLLGGLVGAWPADALQALAFGFHHGGFHQRRAAFVTRAVLGFVFGALRLATGTLAAAMIVHFVVNALIAIRPPRRSAS